MRLHRPCVSCPIPVMATFTAVKENQKRTVNYRISTSLAMSAKVFAGQY